MSVTAASNYESFISPVKRIIIYILEFSSKSISIPGIAVLRKVKRFVNILIEGKKKIVITCPHCVTTIGRDYAQSGFELEMVHHTQLLNQLIREKKLLPVKMSHTAMTYHDPSDGR